MMTPGQQETPAEIAKVDAKGPHPFVWEIAADLHHAVDRLMFGNESETAQQCQREFVQMDWKPESGGGAAVGQLY